MSKVFSRILATLCLAAAFGCAAEEGTEAINDEQEVASTTLELGENACFTNACTAANSCIDVGNLSCRTWLGASSPNANYGTSNCVNAYNMETTMYAETAGYELRVTPVSGLTQAECSDLYVYAKIAYRVPGSSTWNIFKLADGTDAAYRYKGSWVKGLGGAYECKVVPRSDNTLASSIVTGSTIDVRVSARATVAGAKKRVKIMFVPNSLCVG